VSEVVSWGNRSYAATGLGAYIALHTQTGDIHRVALGVGMMSLTVVLFNKCVWRPLYVVSAKRLRLD
jgi:NitT/TauT family transport system permease protein